MVSCPFCSKIGLFMVGIGFMMIIISMMDILFSQYLVYVGLGLVISAYIIPDLIKSKKCKDESCEVK